MAELKYQDASNYNKKIQAEYDKRWAGLTKEFRELISAMAVNRERGELAAKLSKTIRKDVPSAFFKTYEKELKKLMDSEFIELFYIAIDACNQWQISHSPYRRSYRSRNYRFYFKDIAQILKDFAFIACIGEDRYRLFSGEGSEELQNYIKHYETRGMPPQMLFAMLEKGDPKLEELIEKQILEEGGVVKLNTIRCIVMSRNTRLFELLKKLLLAARLQEGLRQSICENMDFGTKEAFLFLLDVILENDLIRFSSVQRAISTCTGLYSMEEKGMERVTDKQVKLIRDCLSDEKKRAEYMASTDHIEIYIALWSLGFSDIDIAKEKAQELILSGTREQSLTASYFLAKTDIPFRMSMTILNIFEKKPEDFEVQALLMPACMSNISYAFSQTVMKRDANGFLSGSLTGRVFTDYDFYFESLDEARHAYDVLLSISDHFPKKKQVFEGIVFPWVKVILEKKDYVTRMAFCASACMDKNLTKRIAKNLSEIDNVARDKVLRVLLNEPCDQEEYEALAQAVGDNETYTRRAAAEMLKHELERDTSILEEGARAKEGRLPKACYTILEDLLRLKKADVCAEAITLLMTMEESEKIGLVSRLLSDPSEEKRSAGLDILLQMKKDDSDFLGEGLELAKELKDPSTKEKIILDQILESSDTSHAGAEEGFGLYDPDASYEPQFDPKYTEEALAEFARVFPNSSFHKKKLSLFKKNKDQKENWDEMKIFQKLEDLIEKNKDLEYTYMGEKYLLGNDRIRYDVREMDASFPFPDMWEAFYEKEIHDEDLLLRCHMLISNGSWSAYLDLDPDYAKFCEKLSSEFFGKEMSAYNILRKYVHGISIDTVISFLGRRHKNKERNIKLACALYYHIANYDGQMVYRYTPRPDSRDARVFGKKECEKTVMRYWLFQFFQGYLFGSVEGFPYHYAVGKKFGFDYLRDDRYVYTAKDRIKKEDGPSVGDYFVAYGAGIISKDFLYKTILSYDHMDKALETISSVVMFSRKRSENSDESRRVGSRYWVTNDLADLLGRPYNTPIAPESITEEEQRVLDLASAAYDEIVPKILSVELTRGDSPTVFTPNVNKLRRIYGLSNFVAILSAMGKSTFNRSLYMGYRSELSTKPDVLSYLLAVCVPDRNDGDTKTQAKLLREKIAGTDITEKRLIEAALFSPAWLEIVNAYLGWDGFVSGCYYFMAHMNERFDERRKATIAKYSPISEEEFQQGAFDKTWFDEVYKVLGKKRFEEIYACAKYISDGAKHSRARKYADAATGKLEAESVKEEIVKKRNKDLLMAYGIIPGKKEELRSRYTYIRQFMKEARGFGAQRRASETACGEMAIKNMAMAEGYADETRFILKMENEIASEMKGFWKPVRVDDVEVCLVASDGKIEILTTKDGKALKSLPARLKKDPYIEDLQEAKKAFTEQFRRTKLMLEEAMEGRSAFEAEELSGMDGNPALSPLIRNLVFEGEDGTFGLWDELSLKKGSKWFVAHPFDMYTAGVWRDLQKKIYDRKIVQPFKQVFRELYLKTDEEKETYHSPRYAGNQIQVKKTIAVLKTRKWLPDEETGLQKVYYKENVIATMWALADWFSPSDIEAPTLEYVVFLDRKTFKEIKISDVPDILFSEVMRDVDLAVSVAHAGQVDPEMSHSTIEMRHAIAEFTCQSFGLKNVSFTESHAIVEGTRASYTVHLGSGVIHQRGGAMINVLPVHSQQRGRIFLPFVDDDPKTSEVISKILLFAEDKKIKDPFILEQIM